MRLIAYGQRWAGIAAAAAVFGAGACGLRAEAVDVHALGTVCGFASRDLAIDAQGSSGTARIAVLIGAAHSHRACRLARDLSVSIDQGDHTAQIEGNPAQPEARLTLRSNEHAEVVLSWANWCGRRSRAFRVGLLYGSIRRETRIRILPTCLDRAHRSTLEVVSVRADTR